MSSYTRDINKVGRLIEISTFNSVSY